MTPAEKVNYRIGEGRIFLPNEIFDDLKCALDSPSHIAFAYSYTYLITYLYRYSKYVGTRFTQPMLKQILGYSPNQKAVDYIIKKDGVLDTLGYTRSTSDYPVCYELDHNKMPEFTLMSEWKQKHPEILMTMEEERNYKIKFPVKAFYRDEQAEREDYYDGTFFDASNTHGIQVKTFLEAMDPENELGCMGFYLYGYLVSRIGQYGGSWTAISIDQMVAESRLSKGSVETYIKRLRERGLLTVTHQNYFDNPDKLANVYQIKK